MVATMFWILKFVLGFRVFSKPNLLIFLASFMLDNSHYFSDFAPVTITFPLENIMKVALG
jgi:hypothetical protein